MGTVVDRGDDPGNLSDSGEHCRWGNPPPPRRQTCGVISARFLPRVHVHHDHHFYGHLGARPTTTTTTDAPAAPRFSSTRDHVRCGGPSDGGVTPGGLPALFGPTRPPVFTEMVASTASNASREAMALHSQAITARLSTFRNVGVSRLPDGRLDPSHPGLNSLFSAALTRNHCERRLTSVFSKRRFPGQVQLRW